MTDDWLPIDAYGVIGNDDRCALVGENGSIDWLCLPHLESPSVFAAILDPDVGGHIAVSPTEAYESTQCYVDRTNVLETTFETDSGVATVTDFMPVTEGDPPDSCFQQAIYRKIEGDRGSVEFDLEFVPRFDYARAETSLESGDKAAVVARCVERDCVASIDFGPEDERSHERRRSELYLQTDLDVDIDPDAAAARAKTTVEADDSRWICVQYGGARPQSGREYEQVLEGTIAYWRDWLETCEASAANLFEFEPAWRDALVRSALVLKLLIHEETGSIPAAPTTSLPEEFGGDLNWDYRYNWIRDAKFTIQALYSVGQSAEASDYFEWFREIGHESPEEIQPLYGLHGETGLEEAVLEHLSGYRDSRPVRIGNAAAAQDQLDIYGTIVQGIYETIRYDRGLSAYDWESVRALAGYVCDHWDERDKGIWEFRDLHEHFVHSKLLCWVALDRALRLAEEYDREGPTERWATEREAIREAIETRGYNEEIGSFVQYFDAEGALDATVLLIPLYDFLPADDERVQSTIDTVLEELTTDDGLVYRFADSPARPKEPGGFVICTCWLVDALALSGRLEEAEAIFEGLLERTSSLGLLSEMIHAEDGAFLGNFPQAFSHIGLLNSAIYLASASDAETDDSSGEAMPLFRRHSF